MCPGKENYFRYYKRLRPIAKLATSYMEGFQVIGMNLVSGYRLGSVWMLWVWRLICRPFAPSFMPL